MSRDLHDSTIYFLLKQQVGFDRFGLGYHDKTVFATSRIWIKWWIFMSYRILVAVYGVGWLIAYVISRSVTKERGGKTFIFLSVWAYITFVITHILITTITCKYYIGEWRSRRNNESLTSISSAFMNYLMKISWIFYTITVTLTFLVTIGYYVTVDSGFDDPDVYSLHIHGVTMIIMIIDLVLARIPVMLFHFYAPMLYLLVYIVFTGVYAASGGTDHKGRDYIYSALNYRNELGISIGWAIFLVLLTIIFHCVLAMILLVRDYVAMRCSCWYKCAAWQVGGDEIEMGSTVNPSGQQVSYVINSSMLSSHDEIDETSL